MRRFFQPSRRRLAIGRRYGFIDGSTDHSEHRLSEMAAAEPNLRVWVLPKNRGKGAAVLFGMREARALGFTHVLTLDSDGQHPTASIPEFMQASLASPNSMVLGEPVFDDSAPGLRVKGRKISNWWANLETLWAGFHDSLFGFRVYPIGALIDVMHRRPGPVQRVNSSVEAVVWLLLARRAADQFTRTGALLRPGARRRIHFRYGRDNALLAWMHFRLFFPISGALAAACRPASPPEGRGRVQISGRTGPHLYNAAT